jgi:hypothetical protein
MVLFLTFSYAPVLANVIVSINEIQSRNLEISDHMDRELAVCSRKVADPLLQVSSWRRGQAFAISCKIDRTLPSSRAHMTLPVIECNLGQRDKYCIGKVLPASGEKVTTTSDSVKQSRLHPYRVVVKAVVERHMLQQRGRTDQFM